MRCRHENRLLAPIKAINQAPYVAMRLGSKARVRLAFEIPSDAGMWHVACGMFRDASSYGELY